MTKYHSSKSDGCSSLSDNPCRLPRSSAAQPWIPLRVHCCGGGGHRTFCSGHLVSGVMGAHNISQLRRFFARCPTHLDMSKIFGAQPSQSYWLLPPKMEHTVLSFFDLRCTSCCKYLQYSSRKFQTFGHPISPFFGILNSHCSTLW